MKSLRIIFAGLLFAGLFLISKPVAASGPGKGDVSFVITNQTTQAELDTLQKSLAAKGIDLQIDMVIFNSARQVKRISGTITFSPKETGSFSNDDMGSVAISKKGKKFKIESKGPDAK